MYIKFIGTGTMGSTTRANTSILIDNILFDCGMGTVKQIERLGIQTKNIRYLVITHFHADHFFDIPNLLIGRRIRKECNEKLYIILPIKGRRKIIDMLKFSFADGNENAYENIEEKYNIEFVELDKSEEYSFDNYKIISLESRHGNCVPAYGYLLEKDNITIGYTGDTGINDNLFEMCKKANYLFIDTTSFLPGNKDEHTSFQEVKELADKYKNCKFYAIHRGDYKIIEQGRVIIPYDGDEIYLDI